MFFQNPQCQVSITIILTFGLCIVQWLFSDIVYVKKLTIPINNRFLNNSSSAKHGELNVVLLTDLHIGSCVYKKHVQKVVNEVNLLHADAVFIIGDLIDAPRHLIENRTKPLKQLNSKLGTFYVTGNHEYYYGNVEDWFDLFRDYGINILHNSHTVLNDVCVVGLDDISSASSGIEKHQMDVTTLSNCSKEYPVVVLQHNPAGTKKIIDYSLNNNFPIDLVLSGHTHAAQYYILVPFLYPFLPYFYGEYQILSSINQSITKQFVSAGTFYQGAPMKMPFMSEIWLLNLTF